jgi:hypothetical protein
MLEIRKGNSELAKGNDYAVLIEAGSFTDFSKNAKEASASREHSEKRIAMAIITSNLAKKILADLYIRINKPVSPTRIFNSKDEAIKWLQEKRDIHYLKKNSAIKKSAS